MLLLQAREQAFLLCFVLMLAQYIAVCRQCVDEVLGIADETKVLSCDSAAIVVEQGTVRHAHCTVIVPL